MRDWADEDIHRTFAAGLLRASFPQSHAAMASAADAEFDTFYLQRTTQEFAQDLDKARKADDFKSDSVQFLVHALQQGVALYSDVDKTRVVRSMVAEEIRADDREAVPESGGKKRKGKKSDGGS
ncbi:hypothetical protein HYQ46_003584 [Verticillium longisporum]|nr:hypothetical protein HYQ46_003584 [Verticillium longisporum]